MKNVRRRTWVAFGLSALALILAPIDWRATLIVSGIGIALGARNLWTAE